MYPSVPQCTPVRPNVPQCGPMCHTVMQCTPMCPKVSHYAAVFSSVLKYAPMCLSVSQCAPVCLPALPAFTFICLNAAPHLRVLTFESFLSRLQRSERVKDWNFTSSNCHIRRVLIDAGFLSWSRYTKEMAMQLMC